MKTIYDIIVRPVITEKSSTENAAGKYTFIVNDDCNKIEIRNAVEKIYNVKVKRVNTLNVKGKKVRLGRKEGKKSDVKKAVVFLQAGQKIESLIG